MVKEELVGLCMEITRETLANNKEKITENLLVDCTNEDSYEEMFGKMFLNAVDISVQASVQIVVELLCDANVISEEYLAARKFRPSIHLVKGDKE